MTAHTLKFFLIAVVLQCIIGAGLYQAGLHSPYLLLVLIPPVFLVYFYLRREKQLAKEIDQHLNAAVDLNHRLNEVRQTAQKDSLTGLYSRDYIRERLDEAILTSLSQNQQCALLYLDIDFFKDFNDALGHELGNKLLVSIGQRLAALVKNTDLLGYQGGDEYVIVLPAINDMIAAELVARRVLNEMSNLIELDGHQLSVSASIGIAIGPIDGADGETLIRHAESALKQSKVNGRKGYAFYSQLENIAAAERLQIDQKLRGALERNEFYLAYQPIISIATRRLKGFEVLIRWHNEEIGTLSPAEFIPIAEQIGLISEIGNWVLREAVVQLQQWQALTAKPLVMSINVSPRQFQDESLLPTVKRMITNAGVMPSSIQLEITEGLLLNASERLLDSIKLLKQFGVRLALDDFGTGYSSLSYLNRLPFDVLKIDKSFVDNMVSDPKDAKMVAAIISLARSLKLETVVEGVETPQQLHYLRELDADFVQGYYYSKPLTAKDAQHRYLSNTYLTELDETVWDRL